MVMHEMSPWSMFMSADAVVKAVMISLAFASLVTWTVLFAKMAELFLARRRLSAALASIADARSLREAKLALGSARNLLQAFLTAAVREARLSADVAYETGIKERAASSFAEISRAEARRIRMGMGSVSYTHLTLPTNREV